MKLCLKCYSLWPHDAVFCGKCRRPLGAKRCPKGHANSLFSPAVTCLVCNEGPLDGVPCLSLGWVARLLALLLLVGIWRWGWGHPCFVFCTLWRGFLWGLGILFDTTPGRISAAIRQVLTWYVVLWLLSYLLPQATGRSARQTLRSLLRHLWQAIRSLLRLVLPLLRRVASKAKAGAMHKKDADGGSY